AGPGCGRHWAVRRGRRDASGGGAMSGRQSGVWEAIAAKRGIRQFATDPLAPEDLERILQAGRHAGSSKNRQRWTFVVCRDRDHLRELSEVGPYADHIAGAAVAIALVTPDPA